MINKSIEGGGALRCLDLDEGLRPHPFLQHYYRGLKF